MIEYLIAGKDFVLDLCGVTDILRPIMEMFVQLQGLGTPCWKVITWWEKVKVNMEQLQDEFSLDNPTCMLPSLKANMADVKLHIYQGTKLVPGWIITSTNTVRDEAGKKTIIDSWNAREIKDVENDLKTFVADLITSFDSRVWSCTKDLQNVLVCMDLDTLFTLLCGERLANGKVKLSLGEAKLEVHGQENFQRFFNYICSLPHIRNLNFDEDDEEICFHAAFGSTVFRKIKQGLKQYLWHSSGEHLTSWFSLTKSHGCLTKLSQTDDLKFSKDSLPCFTNTYMLTLEGSQETIQAKLNEVAVYKSIYSDEELFKAIGVEGCVAIDIATV